MSVELDLSRKPAAAAATPNLAGLGREGLRQAMIAAGVEEKKARMRAAQLWRWIYHYGVTDFAKMTDVAKELRAQLGEKFVLERPPISMAQTSVDGTRKWLIGYGPNVEAECVYIPDVGKAGALCVSSQVGCTLTCSFCHTGTQKLVRNLSAAEIVNQIMVARDALEEWPTAERPLNIGDRRLTNIVFMGMGEPLYNLDNVVEALETIGDGDGISISKRRITVSTAGVAPKIPELGKRTGAMLAISLHATNDDLRDELVPLNKKYDLKELFDAIRAYPDLSNSKRVTFEYVADRKNRANVPDRCPVAALTTELSFTFDAGDMNHHEEDPVLRRRRRLRHSRRRHADGRRLRPVRESGEPDHRAPRPGHARPHDHQQQLRHHRQGPRRAARERSGEEDDLVVRRREQGVRAALSHG